MSMRLRIMGAFAACILLPLAAGWASLWIAGADDARGRALDDLGTAARLTMGAIEERLAQNLTHLKAWSTMPMMQEVLINDDGGELARVLADLNRTYPDFASLTVTNARGAVIATTDGTLRKADLIEAPGIKEAISGRATQSIFTKLNSGTPDAMRFTVPLVASYDQQTVIGTVTGVVDIKGLAGRILHKQGQAQQHQILILARQQDRQVLFSTHMSASIANAVRTIDVTAGRRQLPTSVAGEPGIASIARSGARTMGLDPGLVIMTFTPASAITATVGGLSDMFILVAGIAAMGTMLVAWHWATPLVELARHLAATRSRSHYRAPARTFTGLADLKDAAQRLKALQDERDVLAREAGELSLAVAMAKKDAGQARERLLHLGDAMTARMSELTELVELINQQNLAAAGMRFRQPELQDLTRAMLGLLQVIHEAIETAHDPASDEPLSTLSPEMERRSA